MNGVGNFRFPYLGKFGFLLTGYFSGPEIKACTEANITPMVPKPMSSNAKAEGRFSKADFIYIAKDDEYQCPAGERAIRRFTTVEHGMILHKYWTSACPRCPLRRLCTTRSYRRITRWEHEAVLEAMQRRLDRKPDTMTLRRRTIEHVFGTLQHWMGSTHFLTRGLEHVGTEMCLQVLAYNFKHRAAQSGHSLLVLHCAELAGRYPIRRLGSPPATGSQFD